MAIGEFNPLLNVQSLADIQAQKDQAEARVRQQEEAKKKQDMLIDSLSAYVKKCFEDAQYAKEQVIEPSLISDQRQYKGEYAPDVLAAITEMGGTQQYFNLTKPKCKSLVAWLQDVLLPTDDLPFTLEATPIPELKEEEALKVEAEINAKYANVPYAPGVGAQIMAETIALYEQRLKRTQDSAKKKAKNMERKIKDQMIEGEFATSFNEFCDMLSIYKNAFFKWQIEQRKRLSWDNGTLSVKMESIPVFRNVDPHDCYPAPNSKKIDDSYFCEIEWYRKSDLSMMRDAKGWKREAIDKVLSEGYGKDTITEYNYTERADLENRTLLNNNGISEGVLRGILHKGQIQGKWLKEWGLDGIEDENGFYPAKIILIGDEVIFAELNSDIMGRMHYYTTSFDKAPGSLWGISLPETLAECQSPYASANRALINNMAYSCRPQLVVDTSLTEPGQDPTLVQAGGVYLVDGSQNYNGRKAREFFDVPNQLDKIVAVIDKYNDQADNLSRIPKYAEGSADVGGAGATASGLNMLMTAGGKNVKQLLRNIDIDVLRPLVEDLYIYNMMHSEDDSIKGDCQVKAKGALTMFVKETTNMRRQEFLTSVVGSEYLQQIVGRKGIAAVVRSLAESLGFDHEITLTDEELDQMLQQEQEAAQMQMQMEQQAQQQAQQTEVAKQQQMYSQAAAQEHDMAKADKDDKK